MFTPEPKFLNPPSQRAVSFESINLFTDPLTLLKKANWWIAAAAVVGLFWFLLPFPYWIENYTGLHSLYGWLLKTMGVVPFINLLYLTLKAKSIGSQLVEVENFSISTQVQFDTSLVQVEKAIDRLRFMVSVIFKLLGVLLLFIGVASSESQLPGFLYYYTIFAGVTLFFFGKRIGTRSLRQAIMREPDLPLVLYLRSFSADYKNEGLEHSSWYERQAEVKEEEILEEVFGTIGHFAAIGQPGEWMPKIGAARLYKGEEEWQEAVTYLMRKSTVVLVRVGSSKGLLWEVKKAIEVVPPENLIFYFSQYLNARALTEAYQGFSELTAKIFPVPISEHLPQPDAQANASERFLTFDQNWQPHFIGRMKKPKMSSGNPILDSYLRIFSRFWLPRRIGRALNAFFKHKKPSRIKHRLYNDLSIILGTFFSGPLIGGIMIAHNFWRVDRQMKAISAFLAATLLGTTLLLIFSTFRSAIDFSEEQPLRSLSFLTTLLVFFLWRIHSGRRIRQHYLLGGQMVQVWKIFLLIGIGSLIWFPLMEWARTGGEDFITILEYVGFVLSLVIIIGIISNAFKHHWGWGLAAIPLGTSWWFFGYVVFFDFLNGIGLTENIDLLLIPITLTMGVATIWLIIKAFQRHWVKGLAALFFFPSWFFAIFLILLSLTHGPLLTEDVGFALSFPILVTLMITGIYLIRRLMVYLKDKRVPT